MNRRPPRSTRPDTLFPYTALFRSRQRLARKVALAVATAEYHLERTLRTVLDIGCGEGAWRAPLLKLRPGAQYLGFDSSEYAITRYGRHRNLHFARFADFAQLRPCAPVDLLVCSDVLPYLPAPEIDRGRPGRQEERRVGTECVSTGSCERW